MFEGGCSEHGVLNQKQPPCERKPTEVGDMQTHRKEWKTQQSQGDMPEDTPPGVWKGVKKPFQGQICC